MQAKKSKKTISSELSYLFGLLILALGTALMERADFGMSMVVAPAYLLYRKLSLVFPAFTFGMAEYLFQALLLLILSLIQRKGKKSYLFSFCTALLYGCLLDFVLWIFQSLPTAGNPDRLICYLLGLFFCSTGVSFLFRTYLPPEAYELFVKEIAERFSLPTHRVKTVYDCLSCLIGLLLSFLFFGWGHLEGVKLGTIFCALVNGWLIGWIGNRLDHFFVFQDVFPSLKKFFS
jgi:uncharacterized membrane protein YczE